MGMIPHVWLWWCHFFIAHALFSPQKARYWFSSLTLKAHNFRIVWEWKQNIHRIQFEAPVTMLTTPTSTFLALLSSGHRFVRKSGETIVLNGDQIELFADANRLDEAGESTKVLSLEEFFRSASLEVRGGSFKGRQAQLVGFSAEFVKVILPDSGKSTRIKKRFVGFQKKGVRRSARLAAKSSLSSTGLPGLLSMKMVDSLPIELVLPSETVPIEDFGSSSADFQVDEPVEPSRKRKRNDAADNSSHQGKSRRSRDLSGAPKPNKLRRIIKNSGTIFSPALHLGCKPVPPTLFWQPVVEFHCNSSPRDLLDRVFDFDSPTLETIPEEPLCFVN